MHQPNIFLIAKILSIFSCAYPPFVNLLWRTDLDLNPMPIFQLGCLFSVELFKFFVYSGYKFLIAGVTGKYFLPFCGSFFHFPDGII